MRAVIHMDLEEQRRASTAFGNIRNFLEDTSGQDSDLRMVVNSSAVKFFTRADSGGFAHAIGQLASEGVRFLICSNSIDKLGIERSELLPACEIVPAGIVEVVRLQHDGFAYVKP